MTAPLTRGDIERIADERVARALRLLAAKHYVDKDLAHDGEPITPFDCEDLADDMDELVAARLTEQPTRLMHGPEHGCAQTAPNPRSIDGLERARTAWNASPGHGHYSPAGGFNCPPGGKPMPVPSDQPAVSLPLARTAPDPLPPLEGPDSEIGPWHACREWERIAREERAARERERADFAAFRETAQEVSESGNRAHAEAWQQRDRAEKAERERDEARETAARLAVERNTALSELALTTDLYERAAKRLNAIAEALDAALKALGEK